jgi:hypothetical protein
MTNLPTLFNNVLINTSALRPSQDRMKSLPSALANCRPVLLPPLSSEARNAEKLSQYSQQQKKQIRVFVGNFLATGGDIAQNLGGSRGAKTIGLIAKVTGAVIVKAN